MANDGASSKWAVETSVDGDRHSLFALHLEGVKVWSEIIFQNLLTIDI